MSKSLDEMEEDLGEISPFIKPFVGIGIVLLALLCLPYNLFKIVSSPEEADHD